MAAAMALALPLSAQDLTIIRAQDSNHYDPPRTTAQSGAEIIFMLSDTIVGLDEDMKTIQPLLASSWDVSEDALTYTFTIRDVVRFCDGKPMTAKDVAWSLNRWQDPETKSPVRWRMGNVKSITAPDATTVVYELNAPHSELLYQLAQSFGSVIDKDTYETLGKDFGVSGFNGTGPFCWESWTNYMGFKITKDLVGDIKVRQAINLAVNQEAMAEDLFFGEVEPAYSYVSSGALDYDETLNDGLLKYDPERAAALLDELGSPGLRMSSLYEFMPLFRPDAQGHAICHPRRL